MACIKWNIFKLYGFRYPLFLNIKLFIMADVFHQIYIQTVFAVKNRAALINPEWESELQRYVTSIVQNRGNKMLAIGGMPDHIHLFLGIKPAECLSDLIREIKKGSSEFINSKKLTAQKFEWQSGYGAFSYSRSHRDAVCKYVLNQKEHHKKRTFEQEFKKMMADFEVDVGKKEIFEFLSPDCIG